MRKDIVHLAEAVFNCLPRHPAIGITYYDIMQHVPCSQHSLKQTIQYLRRAGMSGKEPFAVVCDPAGQGEPYRYRLISGEQLLDINQTNWMHNRVQDYYQRTLTLCGVSASGVQATSPMTLVGKMFRVVHRCFNRNREEIESTQGILDFDHVPDPVKNGSK